MNRRLEPTRAQELAVLRTVVYASLFDYPLTLDQLHQSLVGCRASKEHIATWWRSSEFLQCTVEYRDGLFFPAGRSDLIATRARREGVSRELLERDQRILSMLARLPFVRMVALSGSLAHLNAEGSADLDLFVITAPHRVWSVTLAVLVLSRLFGWRKHLCLNYVVSERAMKIVPEDLFTANQIIHLRPVFGGAVFERFVKTNEFVRTHYPNFELATSPRGSASAKASTFAKATVDRPARRAFETAKRSLEAVLSFGAAQVTERVARLLYGWHLHRQSSTWKSRDEVRLEPECLKLHTSSHRSATMTRFERAMADALEGFEDQARREVAAARS